MAPPRAGVTVLVAVGVFAGLWLLAHFLVSRAPVGGNAAVDPSGPGRVGRGRVVYERNCASCHGSNLEGQPNWRVRLPNGRLPAPPHDASGHTWHHPDDVLFGIVKNGLVPPYAPAGYASDMPAFGSVLGDDDIRAVLAYIESRWPPDVMRLREEMIRR